MKCDDIWCRNIRLIGFLHIVEWLTGDHVEMRNHRMSPVVRTPLQEIAAGRAGLECHHGVMGNAAAAACTVKRDKCQ